MGGDDLLELERLNKLNPLDLFGMRFVALAIWLFEGFKVVSGMHPQTLYGTPKRAFHALAVVSYPP